MTHDPSSSHALTISIVVAMGKGREIGKDNQLLWHISEDLKNFKKITLGHHMLMGHNTFRSIGRALPGRTSLILSKQAKSSDLPEGCILCRSIEEAIDIATSGNESELMVIGGGKVYEQIYPICHKIYLTEVDWQGEADAYFPNIDRSQFCEESVAVHPGSDDLNVPAWKFSILTRT